METIRLPRCVEDRRNLMAATLNESADAEGTGHIVFPRGDGNRAFSLLS